MEPLIIQSYQIYPVTSEVQQRLILSYLTPMGEYQEVCAETTCNLRVQFYFACQIYLYDYFLGLGFACDPYCAKNVIYMLQLI